MRPGYSWCSRVAGYEVRVQLMFPPSGLGMRSWSCCHHTIPSCCSSSLQERFMSLEKEVFPFMAQDGGTVAFDLQSKFAKSSAVGIMCSTWSIIGHCRITYS